jgi:hypothetical protein
VVSRATPKGDAGLPIFPEIISNPPVPAVSLTPLMRVSVFWPGESFTGIVLEVAGKGGRVKVRLDANAKWEEHDFAAELKDVKPLVVEEQPPIDES